MWSDAARRRRNSDTEPARKVTSVGGLSVRLADWLIRTSRTSYARTPDLVLTFRYKFGRRPMLSSASAAGLMSQLLGDSLEILGERLLKERFRCFSEEEIGAFFLAKGLRQQFLGVELSKLARQGPNRAVP